MFSVHGIFLYTLYPTLTFISGRGQCCAVHYLHDDSQFLIPGFVDTHIHAPQYFFTGTGYDLPLLEWLQKYTFPVESRFKDVEFARQHYPLAVVSKPIKVHVLSALCDGAVCICMCVWVCKCGCVEV